ncbi:unnamed protein product [Dicrocoelium dendriticum]|nr:unnamed protein product [Dicrocoelium dendriticum]
MNSPDALFSLIGFVLGLFPFPFMLFLLSLTYSFSYLSAQIFVLYTLSAFLLHLAISFAPSHYFTEARCSLSGNAWRAFVLGSAFSLSATTAVSSFLLLTPKSLLPFTLYLMLLSFFHWSEFYVTAKWNPAHCSIDVYMLTHSLEYALAVCACAAEYWLEVLTTEHLYPMLYQTPWCFRLFGLLICLSGEALRKAAMITASSNFSHIVAHTKHHNHVLVTHGVYGWFRHPAYVGWFLWVLGTQLLLGNPVCFVGYTVATFIFFRRRIEQEERQLIHFFGSDYLEYQNRVGTGIPFVPGYVN